MPRSLSLAAVLVLLLLVLVSLTAAAAPPPPEIRLLTSSLDGLILEVVVPEPTRKPLLPDGTGPEQIDLEGYTTGPEGLPTRELLLGLPADGAVAVKVEPLAAARIMQGPAPAVPVPRVVAEQEELAMQAGWEWRSVEDQARQLPLATIVEEGYLRDWRVARLRVAPMTYLGDGQWELTPHFRVHVASDGAPEGAARTPQADSAAALEELVRGTLLNGEEAVGWQSADPPVQPATASPLPETTWRIGIKADGIYRLTYEALAAAGVPVAGADPADFHLLAQGQEVALQEVGTEDGRFRAGDAFLFYGQKFHGTVQDEKYTDENVYWLAVDSSKPGLRMETNSVAPSGSPPAADWYTATVRIEQNNRRWGRWTDNPVTHDTWFWQQMTATAFTEKTYSYPITLTALGPDPYTAVLRVEVASANEHPVSPDHYLRLSVNNSPVGEDTWDGIVGRVITLPLSSELLQEGQNKVSLTIVADAGTQSIYFNWAEVTFRRQMVARDERLDFSAPFDGKAAYSLTGFTKQPIRLYDLSDPFAPLVLTDAQLQGGTPPLNLVFTSNRVAGQPFLAVADAETQDVPGLTHYQPALELLSPNMGADEIMIVPDEFYAAIQPLATHRRAEGLRVEVVRVKDIYALFNGGIFHSEAIRTFLAYAYENWKKPAPAYALLVGDGHFNFKNYKPDRYGAPTPIYIPPYLDFIDPWEGEVPVDTRYGQIVGDDTFPDLAIGRLPANSAQEVSEAVAKIIGYEAQSTPPWQDRIILTADNVPDFGGDFEGVLNRLAAEFIPPGLKQEKIYLTDYCGPPTSPATPCPSATRALTETWSQGAALLTFLGHGAVFRWTHEPLLLNTQIDTLQSGHGLPFVITLNCLDGYWIMPSNYPGYDNPRSMAEWMVMADDHGSIASFSPAGLGTTQAEDMIARDMYDALFFQGVRRLGEIALAGQLTPVGFPAHLPQVSTLFGDPAGWLKLETTERRLVFTPDSSSSGGVAGSQVVYGFTLTNKGDFVDGATLSVMDNTWPTTLSATQVGNLAPKGSTAILVTVSIPSGRSPGDKDVGRVTAISTSDPDVRASARIATRVWEASHPVHLPLVLRHSGRP